MRDIDPIFLEKRIKALENNTPTEPINTFVKLNEYVQYARYGNVVNVHINNLQVFSYSAEDINNLPFPKSDFQSIKYYLGSTKLYVEFALNTWGVHNTNSSTQRVTASFTYICE